MLDTRVDGGTEEASPPGRGLGDVDGSATWCDRLFWASLVAAVVPIVVATVRAGTRGWLAIGDNGYFAIRSRDVLTEHHPLLGTWTSASLSSNANFNNPGPLLFEVLAGPAKLIDGDIGLAIGAALLNVLAVVGIALVVRRRGGPVLGIAAVAVAAALMWSMGSELLFDPWQPHSLLLPFLLFVALAWSMVDGDLVAVPLAVGMVSLLVQTHMSYAVLGAALAAWGVLGMVAHLRRRRRDEPAAWPTVRRRAVGHGVVAGGVALLCWAQPLVEQFFREGNLVTLATNAGGAPVTVGPGMGARLVADILVHPPAWLRPSFAEAFSVGFTTATAEPPHVVIGPSPAVAALLLAVLALVLALVWADARRRGDRGVASAVSTAVVGVGAALVTAAQMPIGPLGIAPHQFRWLWPLGAFVTLVLVVAVIRRLHLARAASAAVLTGLVVLVSAANIPSYNVESGPSADVAVTPTVAALKREMSALEGEGTLLVDLSVVRFAEPYSAPVMAELQRRGIPFVVDDEGLVHQLGPSRRRTDEHEVQRLLIREGDATTKPFPGARRVALVEGLTGAEKRELERTRQDVAERLRAMGEVPLDADGTHVLGRAGYERIRQRVETMDVDAMIAARSVTFLVEHDLLDLAPRDRRLFRRYTELQRRWDLRTVALYLAPDDPSEVAS